MYAIVRTGGNQRKVAVGDVLEVDRLPGNPGESVTLPALLLVDGEQVTSDPRRLAGITVTAEVIGHQQGPKLRIQTYKNKTGYRRRLGYRSKRTALRVTGIDSGE